MVGLGGKGTSDRLRVSVCFGMTKARAGFAPPRGPRSSLRNHRTATLTRAIVRTSALERDLNLRPLAGELERPPAWTGEWVRHRMVEAFTIERRIPDKRVGPATVRNTWKLDTTDTFATHRGSSQSEP